MISQVIGMIIGALMVGWVACQAVVVAVRTLQRAHERERRFAAHRADFWRRVEASARLARASKSIPDWEGWRPFRVAAIVDECRDVKSFYLVPVDGRPLARYGPGQHLTFRLPVDSQAPPLVRCYSLSACPREEFYRCTIKRIAASTPAPADSPGRSSSYLHERVRVGAVLDLRAPSGTFLIDPQTTEPLVLIGAGIGITPLVAMLDAIVLAGTNREVHLLFGFRSSRDQPFKKHLQNLANAHPNIHRHVSFSDPHADDVLHRDYNHRGRMTIERVRELLPSNNYRFYVCGPAAMMEELVPALWEWGVPESHVHFEAFGPASVKRVGTAARTHGPAEPCEVRFNRSDHTGVWDGAFKSLLEFGEAAGVVMPSGCRAGSCGECMLAIRGGAVETIKTPGIAVPEGHCLACISVPECDLVLDA